MEKTKRFEALILALVLAFSIPNSAWAQGGMCSLAANEHGQTLRETAQHILECKSGEFPRNSFAICEELLEIDPILAKKALDHIESIAIPIENMLENSPEPVNTFTDSSNSSDRRGMYVRDGDGGYYVYFDEDDLVEEAPSENGDVSDVNGIEPFNYNDYDAIVDPRYNAHCNSVCKVFSMYNGKPYFGSGFYVGDDVVATAAHMLWNVFWEDTLGLCFADEVYVKQAYAPKSTTSKEPYGIAFATCTDCNDMVVGASWRDRGSDDDDWGAFKVTKKVGGYSYRPKKQIDVKTYIGENITIYGYPQPDPSIENSMFRVKGKTVSKPSGLTTTRVLYGSDTSGGNADGWHGMSGSPVLDKNGNVIAIFIGKTLDGSRSMAVSLDKWLYAALKKYE